MQRRVWHRAVFFGQVNKTRSPTHIGAAGDRHRFRIAVGNNDKSHQAHFGRRCRTLCLAPNLSVSRDDFARTGGHVVRDHIQPLASSAFSAVWRMCSVPQRRMWLLKWCELHGDVFKLVVASVPVQRANRKRPEDELKTLGINLLPLLHTLPIIGNLERYGAAPKADFQPTATHMVENADFFQYA